MQVASAHSVSIRGLVPSTSIDFSGHVGVSISVQTGVPFIVTFAPFWVFLVVFLLLLLWLLKILLLWINQTIEVVWCTFCLCRFCWQKEGVV